MTKDAIMTQTIYLTLGSNLGDREKNIREALMQISCLEGFEMIASSPLYINQAVDMKTNAPDFLNMAVMGEYKYRPLELLNAIELIEKNLGRTGKGKTEPRPIDIDIALFGDEVIEQERLSVPHRKLTERIFMLMPIVDIDPEIVHPVTGDKLSGYIIKKDADKMIVYRERVELNV